MFFGIILSVLSGNNILGKLSFASKPISEILKNWLFGLALSLEEPMFPLNEISKVSAPLKTFLIPADRFPVIPKS
jgi:hypothetical protein